MKQRRQNADEGAKIPQNNADDFEKSSQNAKEMQQPSGNDVDDENVEPQNNVEDLEDSEHLENNDEDAEQSSQNNEDEDQTNNEDSQETIGNENKELRDVLRILIGHTKEGQNLFLEISFKAVQQAEENTKAEIEQEKMNSQVYADTHKELRFIFIFTRTFNRKLLFVHLCNYSNKIKKQDSLYYFYLP